MNKQAVIVAAIIAAVLIIPQTTFIVDEREYVLVLQLGEHKRTIDEAGLHFKIPLIQNLVRLDKRVQTTDAPPDEFLTVDMERLLIDHVSRWYIDNPLQFYVTVRDEPGAVSRLQNIIVAELRDVVSSELILNVISGERETIMNRVTNRSAERVNDFGIGLIDIRMKRVDVPPEVEESVFERMRAERERIAARHRAEGEERALAIRAQADADRNRILGEGEARATRIFAEGFAEDMVRVTHNQSPVSGAVITVNRREIGPTDFSGQMPVSLPYSGSLHVIADYENDEQSHSGELTAIIEHGRLADIETIGELNISFLNDPHIYHGYTADEEFYRFMKTLESYESFLPQGTTLVLGADSDLFDYLRGPGSPQTSISNDLF
ncbi:protease modulator HflC [Desulfonatronovibrio magnus]|uniref:protease modulator HflC n=1 Tax=Desulfonatronovibrio magnus TaxID=698827 RepID=UPI0006972BB2|nr:protease modulator HflC [Desulfonatronovibrio magnus]